MVPIIFLDTNALYGRKPFTQSNSTLLMALSESGYVKLVMPEVVLHELSRQWAEEVQTNAENARSSLKKLNDALMDIEAKPAVIEMDEPDRTDFYTFAADLFTSKRAEIVSAPDVSVNDLLAKELEVKKPFARKGTGFRDALIWETIREVCVRQGNPKSPVIFVTNNHTDFCDKKGGTLHPDLSADLPHGQSFQIVPSLHHLLEHDVVKPHVKSFRVLGETFTPERLNVLIDQALAELYGKDVEEVLGVYAGDGLYELPINTSLESSTFDSIDFADDTITSEIYKSSDELIMRVTVDAECSLDGFIPKGEFFIREEDGDYGFAEDWNDHYFRTSTVHNIRFTFSANFTEQSVDDVVLSLDEAEEL